MRSEDDQRFKFEVISAISNRRNDSFKEESYKTHFNIETNGGWIDINNIDKRFEDFEWITNLSKEETRDLKLGEIGI